VRRDRGHHDHRHEIRKKSIQREPFPEKGSNTKEDLLRALRKKNAVWIRSLQLFKGGRVLQPGSTHPEKSIRISLGHEGPAGQAFLFMNCSKKRKEKSGKGVIQFPF